MISEVEVNHKDVVGWYNLHDCGTACAVEADCKKVVKSRPIPIMNYEHWPTCPIRITRSPHWQSVTRLYNAKQVSPLAKWPHGFAAWVVDALCELESAFNRKQAAEIKKASGGNRGRR